jgi:hypothetical protein
MRHGVRVSEVMILKKAASMLPTPKEKISMAFA